VLSVRRRPELGRRILAAATMLITQILVFTAVLTVFAMVPAAQYYSFPHILRVAVPQGLSSGIGLAVVLTLGQVLVAARGGGEWQEKLRSTHRLAEHLPGSASNPALEAVLRTCADVRSVEQVGANSLALGLRRRLLAQADFTHEDGWVTISVTQRWPYLLPDLGAGKSVAERLAAVAVTA